MFGRNKKLEQLESQIDSLEREIQRLTWTSARRNSDLRGRIRNNETACQLNHEYASQHYQALNRMQEDLARAQRKIAFLTDSIKGLLAAGVANNEIIRMILEEGSYDYEIESLEFNPTTKDILKKVGLHPKPSEFIAWGIKDPVGEALAEQQGTALTSVSVDGSELPIGTPLFGLPDSVIDFGKVADALFEALFGPNVTIGDPDGDVSESAGEAESESPEGAGGGTAGDGSEVAAEAQDESGTGVGGDSGSDDGASGARGQDIPCWADPTSPNLNAFLYDTRG